MSDHEQTLRDAEKLLRLIGSPCPKNAQGADHEWHECPRCEMLHALEQRDSLARRLVLAGADALVREKQTCGNCAHRIDWPDAIGCNNGRGLNRDEVSPGDFCSEWATREAE